ncbi:c-type cytochrome [Polyangium spumosum]|uniref:c-type cytochrome n=1 Tax=Polyangium spumosum TaxID=889282 RepID=UPI001478585D
MLARSAQRTLAFVANEDDAAIHTIDLDARDEVAVMQLPGSPSALVGLSDGRLVVALRDRNEVLVLEAAANGAGSLEARCRTVVPSEPVGLSAFVAGAGERIVVVSGYGHTLGVLSAKNLAFERTANLSRDPRAVVISGEHAFVSHVVSAELSVVELATGKVDELDVLSGKMAKSIGAARGDLVRGGQAFSLATNEGRLFVPMVTVDPGEPKITTVYGGTESPIKPFVGVVDLVARKPLDLPLPGRSAHSLECLLPRAAAAKGDRLFVTCLGSDTLLELDGRAQNAAELVRRRVRLPGGPLGLALSDRHAIVVSQFDRAVSIVDLDGAAPEPLVVRLSRPRGEVDAVFDRGRRIFHDGFDPRISSDGRACASCHPEGREDGLTWSTPDGPRQTISLAGRLASATPFGWFGEHGTLSNHLAHTVSRLGGQGFAVRDHADLTALATYITRMKAPVITPDPASEELVARGRELFHDAAQGCGDCHAGGGTDRGRHDVGTGGALEARLSFDTPSLLSIAGSAPYFHDGRHASLSDLLAKADDKMGHARHLSADARAAMVAYMESLGPAAVEARPMREFVRPAGAASLPPVATSPMERLVLRQRPPRGVWENVDFDLGALPTVVVESGLQYDEKVAAPQGGVRLDLLVWKSGCAAVPYHAAAQLMLDWRSTGMTRLLERCVSAPDEDGRRHWRDILVQTIDPLPDGRLHVEQRRGFIHVVKRETWFTSSIVADAVPVANGLAFVFRTSCGDCKEGEREALHVVSPSSTFWGDEYFSWKTLRLDEGTADSASRVFNVPNLERWRQVTKVDVQTGGRIGAPRNARLRIDTSRTLSEDTPRVAVGLGTCVESDFRCD